ncbi:MAG: lipid A export permease/ATP-binding protein MsbA [Gammaproteobacteria bacterium]
MTEITARTIYRRLLGYLGPYWAVLAVGVIGMVVYAASQLAFTVLLRPLVDGTFVARDPWVIKWVPLAIVAVFVIRGIAEFTYTFSMQWIGRRVVKQLRGQLFDRLLDLPTRFYDSATSGALLSKMTYNVEQVAEAASKTLVTLVRDSLTVVALVGYLLWLNALLSLFVFIGAPIIVYLLRVVSGRFRRYSTRIQSSMGDVTEVTEEAIEGHRVVKTFGGQRYERERFEVANENNRRLHVKHGFVRAVASPIIELIAGVGIAAVIFFATRPAVLDTITVGGFISFLAALLLLNPPLKQLTNLNAQLQQGIAAAQSIFEVIDQPGEPDPGAARIERARGEVSFREVDFSYTTLKGPVLSGITLDLSAGERVALVGRSGSGKSTLVGLLPRFYEPSGGQILLDGRDIREYRLQDLRAQIALVSQHVTLFNDSVARNIAYGQLSAAREGDIIAAAEAAHAMEFISALPDGLDTLVGDNGVLLSGGQRQRLAIARALLKNAPILILDEATSALDTEAERHIQAALDNLMRARTTLVIAHRLSTIESADRIVVLDAGRIVESGTHPELLALDGLYASLYRLQFTET